MIVYSYQIFSVNQLGFEQWLPVITLKNIETGKHDFVEALECSWSESRAKTKAIQRLNELRKGV